MSEPKVAATNQSQSGLSPLPWRVYERAPNAFVLDAWGRNVLFGPNPVLWDAVLADAAFIVRCVNSHEALTRAVRDVIERHDVHAVACNFGSCGCADCKPLRAALALAEGQ